MKVINPLFRNQDDEMTTAYSSCTCICNVDMLGQHNKTEDSAWWWFVDDCGCGCNPSIDKNENSNRTKADAAS